MRIIGKGGGDFYIAMINHTELEKFLGLYYGNMKRLEVGSDVDLGKGYDYAADIQSAMKKTSDLITSNQSVIAAIMNGLTITAAVTAQADGGMDERTSD